MKVRIDEFKKVCTNAECIGDRVYKILFDDYKLIVELRMLGNKYVVDVEVGITTGAYWLSSYQIYFTLRSRSLARISDLHSVVCIDELPESGIKVVLNSEGGSYSSYDGLNYNIPFRRHQISGEYVTFSPIYDIDTDWDYVKPRLTTWGKLDFNLEDDCATFKLDNLGYVRITLGRMSIPYNRVIKGYILKQNVTFVLTVEGEGTRHQKVRVCIIKNGAVVFKHDGIYFVGKRLL